MSSYRLLRSNKESGPFTQEQLIAMGFKPYDLIWVEGKSAGWRYPGEIPELKAYAPMVEEQPFDRFYKKPDVPPRGTPLPQPEAARPAFAPAAASPVVSTARHIHVTLPSGNTLNVTALSSRREPVKESLPETQALPVIPATTEEKKPSFTETISQQARFTPVTETLRGIRTAAVPETAVATAGTQQQYYPARAAATGFSWSVVMGLAIGIATLVGLGVMIGMSINRTKPAIVRQEAPATQEKEPPTAPSNPAPAENRLAANTFTSAPLVDQNTGKKTPEPQVTPQKQLLPAKETGKDTKSSIAGVKKDVKQLPDKPAEKVVAAPAVVEKEPIAVHPKNADAPSVVNLEKQVNIHTNGYKVGAFGGISDLQCTLVNDSHYALELVEVELQYIQANDKIFKTEKLSFHDVAAGSQITMNAPKSPRGIKIIGRIVKINSREPGLVKS